MLPDVTPRPFAFSGGTIPLAQARWIATNPIRSIEILPPREGTSLRHVALVSDSGRIETCHQSCLVVGPVATVDGEESLLGLPDHVMREISDIVAWERANPGEKPFGTPGRPLHEVHEVVADLLLNGPEGGPLVEAVDAALASADQTLQISSLRSALRRDPTDAGRTTSDVLRLLPSER